MPVVDPEKTLHDLTDEEAQQLVGEVSEDWRAARDGRAEREAQALTDYELYLRKEGQAEKARIERKGWSKLQIPLIFWLVETQLPRVGVNPPTITVTATTPDAVPYAEAKRIRLQHGLDSCGWRRPALLAGKQMLVIGDGPVKVPFNRATGMPELISIPWWDFFLSPDVGTEWHEAEWIWHRSWWTKRQLQALGEATDADGRPLWQNLDKAAERGGGRETSDSTYARRREATGYGGGSGAGLAAGTTMPIYEGWCIDGSYVVLGGDADVLLRAEVSPFHDRQGRPIRPFSMFQGTPDLSGPYSIPISQVVGDHQIEITTLRNQWIDQITGNVNSGIAHMDDIPPEDVEAFLSVPNGRVSIPSDRYSDVRQAIMRMPPGQVTGDFPQLYEQIRSESQMAAGVSDISAGQNTADGIANSTATGMSIIVGESNKRVQLLLLLMEIAMGGGNHAVAGIFDAMDRQFGGALQVPVDGTFAPPEGSQGIEPVQVPGAPGPTIGERMRGIFGGGRGGDPAFRSGFAQIGTAPNQRAMDYRIEVDAGSTARPDQQEAMQKLQAFIGGAMNPQIAPLIDWREVARQYVLAAGMNEDKVLLSPQDIAAQQQPQMAPPGLPAGLSNGASPPPPPATEIPVGPPVPLQ